MPESSTALVRLTPASVHAEQWCGRLDRTPLVQPSEAVAVRRGQVLLAVVAHPEDETLAMGGTLASLAAEGVEVHVLCLTSGEAVLDHVGEHLPHLADRRRQELRDAIAALGLAGCTVLGLPDGRLGEHAADAEAAVRTAVRRLDPAAVATLWHDDPHPDHRAASAAASTACVDLAVTEFLLWAVHWTDPADVIDDVAPVRLDTQAQDARSAAMARYRSQVDPLLPHLEAVLPPSVVGWPHECVVLR